MGMDLIGYFVRADVTHAEACLTDKYVKDYFNDHKESHVKPDGSIFIGLKATDALCEDDQYMTEQGLIDLVHGYKDLLCQPPRDTCTRKDPTNPNLMWIFSGGGSWGDRPDGFGYDLFEKIESFNLFTLLGLS